MERNHPASRSSIADAVAWIDAATRRLEAEDVPLDAAFGRVVAADLHAERPIPPYDVAALDGYAVEASASFGAGAYNPLALPLLMVASGALLPAAADAVVPLEFGEPEAAAVTVIEPVAPGDNVDRAGAVATTGAVLMGAGTRCDARHIGLLAGAGYRSVPVVRKPLVRLATGGAIALGEAGDSDGPMLCALVGRDGGTIQKAPLAQAFDDGADLVLVVGGTGPGPEDGAAAALARAGELAIRGVRLRPGETACCGLTRASMPVLLLPGMPPACWWSYELLAGRAIRRLAGGDPGLPYRAGEATTAGKIVSAIGLTEIVRYGGAPTAGSSRSRPSRRSE